MNEGRYVFSQLTDFLPRRVFDRIVQRYEGNRWVRHFTCWNQMLCMMFGQLTGRESLRDLLVCVSAHKPKFYHLGFGKNVSRSNLASANEKRDYRIYEEFAYVLIAEARQCCVGDPDFAVRTKGPVYAFDSTIVDLCLSVFWWAHFRSAKAGIKLHTLYEVRTSIPAFVHITEASKHDVHGMDQLVYEAEGTYIFDRGYVDFKRLFKIDQSGAYFVIRAKRNFRHKRLYSSQVDKSTGIRCDQTIVPALAKQANAYPQKLRRIKYYDPDKGQLLVFLTNNFLLSAEHVALLYRYRWGIELFFKWTKQHLKIKSFWGTTPNAVKTQVYIAIITYTLVAIIKSRLRVPHSTYEMLQILGVSVFDKTPVNQLFEKYQDQKNNDDDCNQLKINLI